MSKFTKTLAIAATIAATAVSCTKQDLSADLQKRDRTPIEISANSGALTRSAIYGTVMPTDRDLHVSAYFNNNSAGASGVSSSDSKNYFAGELFSYDPSSKTWKAAGNEVMYWPLIGSLDFLAYSSDQANLTENWDNTNCAGKLVLSGFDANLSHNDDVLYAATNDSKTPSVAVPMLFKHSKALIVFTAKATYTDAITITDIKVKNVQPVNGSSTLTVTNTKTPSPALTAKWENLGAAANVSVPGLSSANTYIVPKKAMNTVNRSGFFGIGGEGILVAPQAATSFEVTFTQKGNGEPITEVFTYDCSSDTTLGNKWEAGKRYIYALDFNIHEISVSATVEQWDTVGENNIEVSYTGADGIQLWEDGPYWASCNVGATKPWEYGLYFSWGNIDGHSSTAYDFSASNYSSTPGATLTGNIPANATYDAARASLGKNWRIPTSDELSTLLNINHAEKTNINWSTNYEGTGIEGLIVTGKGEYSDKSIFIPAAGQCDGVTLIEEAKYLNLWSSTASNYRGYSSTAYWIIPNSITCRYFNPERRMGFSIRPAHD